MHSLYRFSSKSLVEKSELIPLESVYRTCVSFEGGDLTNPPTS